MKKEAFNALTEAIKGGITADELKEMGFNMSGQGYVFQDPTPRYLPDLGGRENWTKEEIRDDEFQRCADIIREHGGDGLRKRKRKLAEEMADAVEVMKKQERVCARLQRQIENDPEEFADGRRKDIERITDHHRVYLNAYTLYEMQLEAAQAFDAERAAGVRRLPEVAASTAEAATSTQLEHLKTARSVLREHRGEIGSRKEWRKHCPGSAQAVEKAVQRLADNILNEPFKPRPQHYTGFSGGFQRLVRDLWNGEVEP